jgi:hypothetical protein
LICIFHYAGFSNSNNSEPFYKADSLKQSGDIQWAIVEYERIVYNTNDNSIRTIALLNKAECFAIINDFPAAEKSLKRVFYNDLVDTLSYNAHYNTAFYAYLNKNFNYTLSELLLIDNFLPDSLKIKSYPLYALALNELRQWDNAKEKMEVWVNYYFNDVTIVKDSLLKEIQVLYNPSKHPKYKNPEKAHLYSSFIPGMGQLYSGYWADAAISALMQLSGIGIALYGVFVVKYYVAGVVFGYGIFQRFYMAGTKRAEFLANKHNYKTARDYNDNLINAIIEIQLMYNK